MGIEFGRCDDDAIGPVGVNLDYERGEGGTKEIGVEAWFVIPAGGRAVSKDDMV